MIRREWDLDLETFQHREELRNFYNNSVGVSEISSFVLLSGLLSEITTDSQVIAHNLCVRKLEEIGLLDEEGLESLIKYLLSKPSEKRLRTEDN